MERAIEVGDNDLECPYCHEPVIYDYFKQKHVCTDCCEECLPPLYSSSSRMREGECTE